MVFNINGEDAWVKKIKQAYTRQAIEFTRTKRGEEYILPTQREFALSICEVTLKDKNLKQQEKNV